MTDGQLFQTPAAQKRPTAPRKAQPKEPYTPGPFKRPSGRVLALDLGTLLGYAYTDADQRIHHGSQEFSPKHGQGQRWVLYRTWLHDLVRAQEIETIVYEDVKRHAGTIAAHVYGGFLAYTWEVADRELIRMHAAGVSEVKKMWSGNGAAKKEQMIAMAVARGFRPKDDNASDALAIMHYLGSKGR